MSRSHTRLALTISFIAIAAFVLAACQGSSASPVSAKPVDVQVTLTEMKITLSLNTFSVGVPYHFIVTNKGAIAHEIMIMPPLAPGNMTMEQMDEMALAHIEADDLPPGATKTLDYTFTKPYPAGQLEFACHVTGHYEAGMHTPIVVK
jgi:uncharacterized cupredoxin-like copper-binding protein